MMTSDVPDHYSYDFRLKLKSIPTKATDKFSRPILILSFILGLMFVLFGIYLLSHSDLEGIADLEKRLPQTSIRLNPIVSPNIFNWLIVLLGAFVMLSSVSMFIRYNKISFDGNYIKVKRRPAFGKHQIFEEPLYNYAGVRLRVKFYQFGILTLNKYIVELYHKDEAKIVPLYISLSKTDIRKIWKEYATAMHMPGITISERGMVSRNFRDLSRSYAEVVSKWHMPKNFILDLDKPSYISYKSRKTGEKMIKIRKIFVDAYSILNAVITSLLFVGLICMIAHHDVLSNYLPASFLIMAYIIIFCMVFYALLSQFTKDIILIAKDKIVVFRKVIFFRIRDNVVDIKHIKGIDINYTPTTDRYYLSIVSDKNLLTVGNKLPPDDLRWIRAVLISEIIGN